MGILNEQMLLVAAAFLLAATTAQAQYGTGSNLQSYAVRGFTTSTGTYVSPHEQTNPNNTQRDNYGTRGNVNPYTGAVGTHNSRY